MEFYLIINKNLNPGTIPIRIGRENSFYSWPVEQVRDHS